MWGKLLQFSFTVYASRENYPNTFFESTADEIALEFDLDVKNTIVHIHKFNFDSYVEE